MSISSIVSRIIPAATAYVTSMGNPLAVAATVASTEAQKKEQKRAKRRANEQAAEYERINQMAMDPSQMIGQRSSFVASPPQQLGFFERLGGIASRTGDVLLSGLESAVPSVVNRAIFGSRPQSAAQGPALTTITNVGAQESQGSGSIQAGMGALLPNILGGARSLLKSPLGQLTLGTGAAGALSLMGSDGKQMRITRKMKSQARMVVNLAQGNLSVAADILNISEDMLVMILLKRFRNDGPVVTKAALRKTKQTIRRLHNMQDVLKSITPTSTGRRRAPMKRAMSTTLIKN